MAGKPGRSGRRRKPDALKIAAGTYRADRQGDPNSKANPKGVPRKPRFALREARDFWDRIVPQLIALKIATALDAPRLQLMCELWGFYRVTAKAVANDPLDKDARISLDTYLRQLTPIMSEFGLNPSSRSKIIVGNTSKKPSIKARTRG